MSCRIESVGAAAYDYCPDELPSSGARLRALVSARVVDEITRLPMQSVEVSTTDQSLALHVVPRVSGGGIAGLAGRPASLFPALATTAADVPMRVAAAGYLPRELAGTLGPIAGFPDAFAPLAHGDVLMHRTGVALQGRVVKRGTPSNAPLSGAQISIDGLWSTFPPPNVAPSAVMEPARAVALMPGLYGDPPAATLARCDFILDVPRTKRLLLPASPGTRRLRLADRQTLAAGMPLLIDAQDSGRREVIGIQSVDTGFSADQAVWVELAYPLQHLHRAGAQVVPASVPATHDPCTLTRPGLRGDPIVFLNTAAPWADLSVIRVDDGAHPFEYQWIEHYATTAGGDGYFRLPSLSRVALVRLRATHPTEALPLLTVVEPDYGVLEHTLTVAFE